MVGLVEMHIYIVHFILVVVVVVLVIQEVLHIIIIQLAEKELTEQVAY